MAKVVEILSTALPDLGFAVENGFDAYRTPAYRGGWTITFEIALPVHDLDVVTSHAAAKLLASHPEIAADELLIIARGLVGDLVEPTHSNGRGLIEMGPFGVTKGTALAHLAAERGVDREDVVAFGDMPNDLPMLARVAGRVPATRWRTRTPTCSLAVDLVASATTRTASQWSSSSSSPRGTSPGSGAARRGWFLAGVLAASARVGRAPPFAGPRARSGSRGRDPRASRPAALARYAAPIRSGLRTR